MGWVALGVSLSWRGGPWGSAHVQITLWKMMKLCQIRFIPEWWLLEPSRLRTAGRGLSPSSWGHLGGLLVAGQPCPRREGLCKGGI